jgi:hypothetical protein
MLNHTESLLPFTPNCTCTYEGIAAMQYCRHCDLLCYLDDFRVADSPVKPPLSVEEACTTPLPKLREIVEAWDNEIDPHCERIYRDQWGVWKLGEAVTR